MNASVTVQVKGSHGAIYPTILDADFADDFDPSKWRVRLDPCNTPYIRAVMTTHVSKKEKKRRISLHRVVALARRGQEVDHINGNTLDNRRENLRICTHAENTRNRCGKRSNPNTPKGAYYRPPSKARQRVTGIWEARIRGTVDGTTRPIYLGTFKTEKEAIAAYNEAAKKYHGEFARLNPI